MTVRTLPGIVLVSSWALHQPMGDHAQADDDHDDEGRGHRLIEEARATPPLRDPRRPIEQRHVQQVERVARVAEHHEGPR